MLERVEPYVVLAALVAAWFMDRGTGTILMVYSMMRLSQLESET